MPGEAEVDLKGHRYLNELCLNHLGRWHGVSYHWDLLAANSVGPVSGATFIHRASAPAPDGVAIFPARIAKPVKLPPGNQHLAIPACSWSHFQLNRFRHHFFDRG